MKRLFFAAAVAIMAWLACGEHCECEAGSVGARGSAGGSLGGNPFEDAAYGFLGSISEFETPTEIHQFGSTVYLLPVDPPTISSPAFGTADILDSLAVFANPSASTVGLYDATTQKDILDITSPAFASFDLSTTMPPTTGTVTMFDTGPIATSAGDLVFTNVAPSAVFSFSAVPEPSSLVMLGTGIIAAGDGRQTDARRGTASEREALNGERGAFNNDEKLLENSFKVPDEGPATVRPPANGGRWTDLSSESSFTELRARGGRRHPPARPA